MKNLPISCWAAEDIPTNKAEKLGFQALTNAELLSILIGSGNRDMNAIELSRRILGLCDNNLNSLAKIKPSELLRLPGMAVIKTSRILAALQLGRRMKEEKTSEKPKLCTATQIFKHFRYLENEDVEYFYIGLLNQKCQLIKDVKISQGGLTETAVDIRLIMRECVVNNATILVCVHNHPSGNVTPSRADISLTKAIKDACQLMRIHFADHVIIGNNTYYSFHEQGTI